MKWCSAPSLRLAGAKTLTPMVGYTRAAVPALIRACVNGEAAAWREFIGRFNRVIAITSYRMARRLGDDSPAVVDDLTRETYLKLCASGARLLREFDSAHPDAILSFLKVVTANVATDYFKRAHARTPTAAALADGGAEKGF